MPDLNWVALCGFRVPKFRDPRSALFGRCDRPDRNRRQFVMRAAVELPTSPLLVPPAPLLEEEGHVCLLALIPDRPHPVGLKGSRAPPRLATRDHPVDAGEIDGT